MDDNNNGILPENGQKDDAANTAGGNGNNNSRRPDISEIEKNFDVENSTIFVKNDSVSNSGKKSKKDSGVGGEAAKSHGFIKPIAFLLCAALVISGAMISLKVFWPVKDGETNTTENENGTIQLTASANVALDKMKNVDKSAFSNVKSINVNNPKGKFTVVPDKLIEAEDDDSEDTVQYKLTGFDNIPQSASNISAFVNNVFGVVATSKLEGEWSEADCGLDKPEIQVDAVMADGSKFTYKVGGLVPNGNNDRYASCSLKDGIYIVTSDYYDSFNTSILDYTDTGIVEPVQSSGENDSYFKDSTLYRFDSIEISGANVENKIELSYSDSTSESLAYRITEPTLTYADDEKVTTLISPLSSGLSGSSVLTVNQTADDLKKYGLDKPYFEIKYAIKNESYHLKFSKPDAVTEGYYAVTVNDVPVVYEVAKSLCEYAEWDLGNIRSSILYARNINTITQMTVDFGGKATVYDIHYDKELENEDETEPTNTTDSAADSEDDYVMTIINNSEAVDEDSFKLVYQHLILVRAYDYLKAGESAPSGEPKLTITCKSKDGSTDVMKFVKYNERYYNYTINGIGDSLIRYDTLEKILDEYTRLQKGEKISDD